MSDQPSDYTETKPTVAEYADLDKTERTKRIEELQKKIDEMLEEREKLKSGAT